LIGRIRLGTALFFALLAATLAVSVLVVRARDPDLELEVTELTRKLDTDEEPARIRFFVRDSEREATVEIVDEDEEPVRTLDRDATLLAGREVAYEWDGRDDRGRIVPHESYFVRIELPSADRSMVWPKRIQVDPPPGR
jgi:flagellar hook assembly protein FlgD